MLVSSGSLDKRITLARRNPRLVAFIFGLVHGLGFASALRDVGLPKHELPLSLLAFNLGVEFGLLGVILATYLVSSLLIRLQGSGQLIWPVTVISTYVVGIVGAYWTISRSVDQARLL
jgi:hypothetical protein